MNDKNLVIKKSLGLMDDLQLGVGKVEQCRSGQTVAGYPVHAYAPVSEEVALRVLDPKYRLAVVVNDEISTYYAYTLADVPGIKSDVAPGCWARIVIGNAETALYNKFYSFKKGNTLSYATDALYDESTNLWYVWQGQLPKIVPPGSTVLSTGGEGDGAWKSVMDASLRSLLASKEGASNIGYKYPVAESSTRTVQSKLSERISILDLGGVLDGVTDDTDAFVKATAVCDTLKVKLWLPAGKCRLTRPVQSPVCGIVGDGHTTSVLLVDVPNATADMYALTYGKVDEWGNSYGKISDIQIRVKDEQSAINLIKMNTTSRGAIMRDCTLHTGAGWCVTLEMCFYYNFDNVVFEGRYIDKNNITPNNELKGGAVRCINTEINNIHFNYCDIRFLRTVFSGTELFKGSNTIKVSNCAIESIGDNVGNVNGWFVDFDCVYFEAIGLNKHKTEALPCCLLSVGVGVSNFNNCLINLGDSRKDKPVFSGIIGRISLRRTQMNVGGRTAPIVEPISYSTRSLLESDDSSCLPPHVADSLGSQWVGGYRGADATVSPVIAASDVALNTFKFQAQPKLNIFSYNDQTVGYINFRTDIPVLVMVRATGVVVVDNSPKFIEFVTSIKFVDGKQVGISTSVIANGASTLAGFTPGNGCTMSEYRTDTTNSIRSFYLKVGQIYGGATAVDILLDFEVSLRFNDRSRSVRGVVSIY